MPSVKITCFADEISHDLVEQMDVLQQEGITHLELRNVWGKNVLDLSDEELKKVREAAEARGFAISSIGSPLGKYPVVNDFAPQLEGLQRGIRAAS
ncbi:hypothetical protein ASG89_22760 [Paenibacillus sp. Soil766]|uniref:hypothetical protein n=1 Tax=Paenibacillus sp. Soil766 TaxID=1736404 RepID=UPI000709389C|nr:hypothetical protein [Paenibacillus sp. Soil766]KRF03286.1 hypothetical protein ASG89_22760 [Paenibacillus sp. Soil766]